MLLWWQGKRTAVITDHNGLLLEQIRPSSCLPWCSREAASGRVQYVPYSEILSCRYLPIRRYCSSLTPWQRQLHYLELRVLQRHPSAPWQWSLRSLELAAEAPELVKAWVGAIRQRLAQLTYRPQRLLVFVNPYGGKRRARATWAKVAGPILAAAGVTCEVVETAYQGHAEAVTRGLSLEQLQQLDGVVAVGGDGLFAELLSALLQHRHLGAALQLRLGHIPAGSTDAVACTLHGTRDPTTAALHIALGDCTALDVGRMATLPEAPRDMAAPAPAPASTPASTPAAAAGVATAALSHPGASVGSDQGELQGRESGAGASEHTAMMIGSSSSSSDQAAGAAAGVTRPQKGSSSGSGGAAGRQQRRWWQQRVQQQQQQSPQPQRQPPPLPQAGASVFTPQLHHFVCVANFGFLGDVMETSERLRWCGPIRYDIAGFLRFLLLRQYKATVWYKPATTGQELDSNGGSALVSPAAVAPLPHHQHPSLHTKLAAPGAGFMGWRRQQQQQHEEQQEHLCTASSSSSGGRGGGSESSSRRSSLDGCQGPMHGVAESPPPVAGAAPGAGQPAAPPSALAAAVAAAARQQAHDRGGSPVGGHTAAGNMAGRLSPTSAAAAGSGGGAGARQGQQGSAGGIKSVSFVPRVAAVHASAASFSSSHGGSASSTAASAAAAAAALVAAASRGSSQTNLSAGTSDGGRCHSKCARCGAAALHHSSSRQSFTSVALRGSEGAPAAAAAAAAATAHDPSDEACPEAAAACVGGGSSAAPGSGPPAGPGWVKMEGRFASIMCVVTSCISDKSRQGLMPAAHLADGRLALVLVEGCSRLQYLRFLVQLARRGIVPGSLPFVRVVYATEVQVEAEGRRRSSSWNVDGELLRHSRVNVGIHAGLVDVFARGVELM